MSDSNRETVSQYRDRLAAELGRAVAEAVAAERERCLRILRDAADRVRWADRQSAEDAAWLGQFARGGASSGVADALDAVAARIREGAGQ